MDGARNQRKNHHSAMWLAVDAQTPLAEPGHCADLEVALVPAPVSQFSSPFFFFFVIIHGE